MADFGELIRRAFAGDGEPELGGSVADAVRDALRPRGVDGEAMLAELRQMADDVMARREARAARNADLKREAWAVYERTRRQHAAAAVPVMASALPPWLGGPQPPVEVF
jgi:hypothetical protein